MNDNDLIRRGDARDALYRAGYGASAAERAIAALPAVTQPAPDAAAIREAALLIKLATCVAVGLAVAAAWSVGVLVIGAMLAGVGAI